MKTKNQNVNNDYLTLEEAIKIHGVSNVRVYMKMYAYPQGLGLGLMKHLGFCLISRNEENRFYTLCCIDESRFKVNEGYKVTIKPIDDRLALEHFYISDFNTILKTGHAKLLVQVG